MPAGRAQLNRGGMARHGWPFQLLPPCRPSPAPPRRCAGYGQQAPSPDCPAVQLGILAQSLLSLYLQGSLVGLVFARISNSSGRAATIRFRWGSGRRASHRCAGRGMPQGRGLGSLLEFSGQRLLRQALMLSAALVRPLSHPEASPNSPDPCTP
jgi:hypothetical protein